MKKEKHPIYWEDLWKFIKLCWEYLWVGIGIITICLLITALMNWILPGSFYKEKPYISTMGCSPKSDEKEDWEDFANCILDKIYEHNRAF